MAYTSRKKSQIYIYGNNAYKLDTQKKANDGYQTIKRHNDKIRQNRQQALRMDLPYLMLLTIAALATLFICCSYLRVQSSITSSIKTIETQEKKLESLKNENDALETRINTSVDLEYIYQVATQELGMVYPEKNQVIQYDKTESEYVRQYENIPRR